MAIQDAPLEPSLWYATAAPAPLTRSLRDPIETDICVIGGGYTGLSTALHLAEANVAVVLLEAKAIGFGGSGRNAGHCTPTFHVYEIPVIRTMLGEPFASRLIQRQTDAANLVFSLIRRHEIDCEGVQTGYIKAAHAPGVLPKMELQCGCYRSVGKATRMLSREEVEHLTGSPRYYGGWFHPEGGHLNPLGYARGLAKAAIKAGAKIFTDSPALRLTPEGERWKVATPHGSVVARKVICGTGAYTTDFWPGLKNTFKTLGVAVMATQPLSDNLRKTIAPGNNTVVDSRGDAMIYKYNKDGRLVTSVFIEGKRGGDRTYTEELMRKKLQYLLPQLTEVDWQYYWVGALDMQPKTFPRLFGLAPNVVASLGYSGRGVPTGTMMGTVLAEWALGKPQSELALPLEPVTAAPFYMSVAPRLMLNWYRFRDQRLARQGGANPPPF